MLVFKGAEVYALVNRCWIESGAGYSETERCRGIFTSKELVVKAATDFLEDRLKSIQGHAKECFMMPNTPLTFEQLRDDSYEYYNDSYEGYEHTEYFGAELLVYVYELDNLKI